MKHLLAVALILIIQFVYGSERQPTGVLEFSYNHSAFTFNIGDHSLLFTVVRQINRTPAIYFDLSNITIYTDRGFAFAFQSQFEKRNKINQTFFWQKFL